MRSWRDWRLRRLVAGSRPIVVGPWRSELGFETLYWLPWLAALRERYALAKDRLIVISRGGAGVWYDAGASVDLYDYVPLDKVRKAMLADSQATGSIKQQAMTGWEEKLLPLLMHDLGIRRYGVVHPSLMYRQLTPWWQGRIGQEELLRALRFTPIPVPPPPLSLPLPERYVAVRFYHRHTWAMNEEARGWVSTLVDAMARRLPVVLLETGFHADDHADFPIQGENILSIKDHVTAQNNLAVQSAVLAKAQAFVGTYGGTMQLAVRLRRPSVGFYQQFTGTAYAHKLLTEWLAVQEGTPCFIGRPDDARMVMDVMQP